MRNSFYFLLVILTAAGLSCDVQNHPADQTMEIDEGENDFDPHSGDDDQPYFSAAADLINPNAKPMFVRPFLPINAYHLAATHNTFIWTGPAAGPTSRVSSLGLIRALDLGQLFMELDVKHPVGDGDFVVNHSNATESVRLSSLLRNVRWWSDTHPGHEMIVLGFQWGAGTDGEVIPNLNALIDRFLAGPSPLSETGPLYALADWIAEMTAPLSSDVQSAIADLTPREITLVLGYPTIQKMRGKVVLEMTGGRQWDDTPSFFKMAGDGQITNDPVSSLDDVSAHTDNRIGQRLTRIYSSTPFNGNYDIFDGLMYGVSNNALNMRFADRTKKAAYVFLDENSPGYAPAGYVETTEGAPTRMGPPVFVALFGSDDTEGIFFTMEFDPKTGLENAPAVFFRVTAKGLSGGDVLAIESVMNRATLIRTDIDGSYSVVFSADPAMQDIQIKIETGRDPLGYEVYFTGPTVASVTPDVRLQKADGTIWISPTFDSINLIPTGNCSVLAEGGTRLFGTLKGLMCDASNNPSFMVEMVGE